MEYVFRFALYLLIILISNLKWAAASDLLEIPISSYIEILDAKWNDKEIGDIANTKEWISAYSDEGKSKLIFQGNWYRLKIGEWLQNSTSDWVMVHPLSAGFKLYRLQNGLFNMSEHGYKSTIDDRIYYRRTAVMLSALKIGEILYFKVSGKPARSSDHPYLTTSTNFITHVSKEFPFSIFYYSVILVVSAIALFAFLILKEKIFLFYSLYMLSTIGVFLGIQGYAYQYTTHWSPGITIFFFGIVNLFIIVFMHELFKLNSKSYKIISFIFACASFGFAVFSLLGHAATAFEGLYSVIIGTQLAVIGQCLYHSVIQKKDRWLLITIALSFFVSGLGLVNDKIWMPFSDIIDGAFQPVSLLEIILFAFILLRRFYHINVEKKEALELAQEKTWEALKLAAEKEKFRADAEIGTAASQTAHDLASPISSLNMLMKQMDTLSEDKRILMRHSVNRINDIVQSLSLKGREVGSVIKTENRLENTLLASLISSIVSEKRLELRINGNVELNAHFENAYDFFASVNPVELKRVISNSINNSVDAFDNDKSGVIDVTLRGSLDQIIITIKDNGCGIPPEVLAKLGQKGVTHGKEEFTNSGSGLGVYHARKTIESFGGEYKIESEQGKGTVVVISLRKESPPPWFVQQLVLKEGQTVVAVDDDTSILEIWKQRLANKIKTDNIKLYTCKTGQCLKDWIVNHSSEANTAVYLIDYEFIQQNYTGLDLMEELNLKEKAILVSSRYEEPSIVDRCKTLGIRAIPKSMAGFVPIIVEPFSNKLDAVLIDDDPLIRMTWEFAAKNSASTILTFDSFESFRDKAHFISPETPINIDVNLANGVHGSDIALKLNKLGYNWIYLATGYDVHSIEKVPSCVVAVRGKNPDFSKNKFSAASELNIQKASVLFE